MVEAIPSVGETVGVHSGKKCLSFVQYIYKCLHRSTSDGPQNPSYSGQDRAAPNSSRETDVALLAGADVDK